jgi:dTDP-4-dehydrorhamnose 3,5-epimerase
VRFTECPIAGAWIIDPEPHTDFRGRFMRVWSADEFAAHGIEFVPVQANVGFNHLAGTTRGLHYQIEPHLEGKLVRCTRGAMFDVLVDLRPGSTTYGQWYGTELTPDNARMLYVPPMCAHGYQTLVDATEMEYSASAAFAPSAARGLRFDDPTVAIRWPLTASAMSDQDRRWPSLQSSEELSR